MMRPPSPRFGAAPVTLILAAVCVIWISLVSAASAHGHGIIHVKSGQSIQAAIDSARDGARILVEAGTYAEQLTIESDGIDLVGHGAILTPPAPPKKNKCSGLAGNDTEAGICVIGSNVDLAPFVDQHRRVLSVGRPVKDVSITGFEVRGFSGENIVVVGALDAKVFGNKLIDGEQYGCLTVGSTNTRIQGNTVTSSGKLRFIGICMDDMAGVHVSGNRVSGYFTGLCVQTSGADVSDNDVSNSCQGAFVDPRINGAQVRENHFSSANPACAIDNPIGVFGVILDGAVNTVVEHNLIEGQTVGGAPNAFAAGVALVDDPTVTPPAIASGNLVTQNILRNNDLDLFVLTNGTGNVVTKNQCSTSIPKELCG